MYFCWELGPKGPAPVLYHDRRPEKIIPGEAPALLACHELTPDQEAQAREEALSLAALAAIYPAPARKDG